MAQKVRRRGGGLVLALGAPVLVAALAAPGCRKASRAPEKPTAPPGPAASAPEATKGPAGPPSPRPGTALTYVTQRHLPGLPGRFDPSGRLMAVLDDRLVPSATGASGPKPGGDKSGGDKSGGDKSGESKPPESKPPESKPGDGKAAESKAAESKPGDGKAGESKPGDGKAGESKAAESKPGDGKPGDGKPAAGADKVANKVAPRATESICALWEVDSGSYLGEVPGARCGGWIEPTALDLPGDAPLTGETDDGTTGELRSRDGQHTVSWNDGELLLRTAAGAAPIKIQAGCGRKGACADVVAAALSPDGKRLAFTRLRAPAIQVIDTVTGKPLKPLKLDGKAVLPGQLGWSAKGLVAVLFELPAAAASPEVSAPTETEPEVDEESDGARSVDVSVMLWPDGQGRGKPRKFTRSYDREASQGHLLLDPLGRYVFELRTQRRDGETFTVFDVASDYETGLGWHEPDNNCSEQVSLQDGHWIPGKWPVWEVIEEHQNECTEEAKQYKAFRIFTAPGQRRLREADLGERDPGDGPPRTVRDDGKTIATARGKGATEPRGSTDAEERWEGTGKGSIRRLSDDEELFFEAGGCVRTGRWVFDCPLDSIGDQVFLIGSDPLASPMISGDQVAHLFYRPGLADDFFSGKPVAPDGAVSRGVGLPPLLEQVTVQPLRPDALQVSLLARDGGDGVSVLRAWLGGRPLGEPLKIGAGQPSQLELTLPGGKCREPLMLFACNGPGTVCSRGHKVPACGKRRK